MGKKSGHGQNNVEEPEGVVGLIPAGGTGSRIGPSPMSKELYPIGFQLLKGEDFPTPKVVSHYLLDTFAKAGIRKTFIIIRKGKWDIPAYFGDGTSVNMHLGYLMMRDPFGPPFTLDQAYPFVQKQIVAFGFPDIIFSPDNVFEQLLSYHKAVKPDVVLALFPAHNPHIMDMVEVDMKGKIRKMVLKPLKTELRLAWVCAVWGPVFTRFMHEFVQGYRRTSGLTNKKSRTFSKKDLTVGAVIQSGIKSGINVHGVTFGKGQYLDIGTPHDLVKAVKKFGSRIDGNSIK